MGVVDIDCSVVTDIYEDSLTIFMIIVWEGEKLLSESVSPSTHTQSSGKSSPKLPSPSLLHSSEDEQRQFTYPDSRNFNTLITYA